MDRAVVRRAAAAVARPAQAAVHPRLPDLVHLPRRQDRVRRLQRARDRSRPGPSARRRQAAAGQGRRAGEGLRCLTTVRTADRGSESRHLTDR
ncbi:hypothetical protein SGPA1_12709 [Streptomyces misionensis JCM 4497]